MPAIRQGSAPEPLELTPTPPALSISIVSPTPRAAAFSFPQTHNLEDSPYASPSNSPFEPSLDGLDLSGSGDDRPAIPAPLPLSAYTRTLTPPNPIPSTSSTHAPAPRRRRNAPLDPNEPRPRRGEAGYVKRPENAFILFRRQFCGSNSTSAASSVTDGSISSVVNPATGKKARQADLSKTISAQWRALAPEERGKWEALAAEKKREHAEKHPDYVYRPQRKTSAFSAEDGKKRKGSMPLPIPSPIPPPVEFVLPRPRSHSYDPTVRSPAPYQSIQVPNVYAASFAYSNNNFEGVPPMSPDDMSLLPMIAQSSSMRGQQDNAFDYVPSFGNALDFEASLQASDFLRAMFPPSANPILSMPPLSLPTGGTPSSSESGSSPGSPYTPASSLVNAPFSTIPTPTPGQLLEAAYADPTPFSLDGATGSDPWTAYGMSLGAATNAPMDFDFDLASIPGAAVGSGWSSVTAPGEDAVMGGDPIVGQGTRNVKEFGINGESAWGSGMEGWNGAGMEGF